MSAVDVASMYACAMTVRQESTVADLLMSNTKSGFLMTLTQNRSGTLDKGKRKKRTSSQAELNGKVIV